MLSCKDNRPATTNPAGRYTIKSKSHPYGETLSPASSRDQFFLFLHQQNSYIMEIGKRLNRKGDKYLWYYDLGREPGQRPTMGVFTAENNKLRKTVTDSTASTVKITTTDYVASMVFQNDSLQLYHIPKAG